MNKNIRLQPLLDMSKNTVLGYEVLYTKNPGEEYPSAEQILKSVASESSLQGDYQLFINMTIKDAVEKEFSRKFLRTLCKLKIDSRKIVLEVNENTHPDMTSEVRQTLSTLRKHGVKIALDDFGSQRSVLDLLHKLPLDMVKIDKDLVQKAPTSNRDSALFKFCVDACHDLGCQVVAEGIETNNQLGCAKEANVDVAQGFLFSAPSVKPERKYSNPFICLADFAIYISSLQTGSALAH